MALSSHPKDSRQDVPSRSSERMTLLTGLSARGGSGARSGDTDDGLVGGVGLALQAGCGLSVFAETAVRGI